MSRLTWKCCVKGLSGTLPPFRGGVLVNSHRRVNTRSSACAGGAPAERAATSSRLTAMLPLLVGIAIAISPSASAHSAGAWKGRREPGLILVTAEGVEAVDLGRVAMGGGVGVDMAPARCRKRGERGLRPMIIRSSRQTVWRSLGLFAAIPTLDVPGLDGRTQSRLGGPHSRSGWRSDCAVTEPASPLILCIVGSAAPDALTLERPATWLYIVSARVISRPHAAARIAPGKYPGGKYPGGKYPRGE
jgi:hypothetical protein